MKEKLYIGNVKGTSAGRILELMTYLLLAAGIVMMALLPFRAEASAIRPSYLYNLSNFTGNIPYNWPKISIDHARDEIYVVTGDTVKVFNNRGMEVYSFGDSSDLGVLSDVAIDNEGKIYVISYKAGKYFVTVCDYKGEPVSKLEIINLPDELKGFSPNYIYFRNGSLYFADISGMRLVVTDMKGDYKDSYDLASLAGLKDDDRESTGINGFNIDNEGNILFTIPAIAKAYIVSPDKTVRSFGKRGSAAGRFGVPGGIAASPSGDFYLVSDTLRCVVMVFNKDLKFVTEFGYRGAKPGNLIGPRNIALSNDGKVYVSQLRRRGVSVYSVIDDALNGDSNKGGAAKDKYQIFRN